MSPTANDTTGLRSPTTRRPAAVPTRRENAPAPPGRQRRRTRTNDAPGAPRAQGRAPRMPFVLLVLALLGGALVSMLVLHAILAQDSFTITELQRETRELSQQEEALAQEVVEAESPEALARRAEELGMDPGEAPRFLDPETGEVTGPDDGS